MLLVLAIRIPSCVSFARLRSLPGTRILLGLKLKLLAKSLDRRECSAYKGCLENCIGVVLVIESSLTSCLLNFSRDSIINLKLSNFLLLSSPVSFSSTLIVWYYSNYLLRSSFSRLRALASRLRSLLSLSLSYSCFLIRSTSASRAPHFSCSRAISTAWPSLASFSF